MLAVTKADAQEKAKQDSLWSLMQQSKADTNKVLLLLQYGELFETGDIDTAKFY